MAAPRRPAAALAMIAAAMLLPALPARAQPADPRAAAAKKFDALNAALDAGVIDTSEYDRQIDALVRSATAAPPPAATAAPQFQSIDGAAGGHLLTATLGPQPSVQAAAGLVLRQLRSAIGARPEVTRAEENPAQHSVALFFTAGPNGTPETGLAIVTAPPGTQATAAVLYDQKARFATSVGPMLTQLQTLTAAAGAAPPPAGAAATAAPAPPAMAPAQPLQRHDFADGTGSIDLPEGWRLAMGGGGSALAFGPGATVAWNVVSAAVDPASAMLHAPPQIRQSLLAKTAVLSPIADPVQAWLAMQTAFAQQKGLRPPSLTVQRSDPIGAEQGLHAARIMARGTLGTPADRPAPKPGTWMGMVSVMPTGPMGNWSIGSSFVFVLDEALAAQGRTAMAVFNSVRINQGAMNAQMQAMNAQTQAMNQMSQRNFDTMIANGQAQNAAREAGTQRALAQDREAQEGMHRNAVAMENYVLNRSVVRDTQTGEHATMGNAGADLLTQYSSRYETVPAQQLLRGVDY